MPTSQEFDFATYGFSSASIIAALCEKLRGLQADYETLFAAYETLIAEREAVARAAERAACAALAEAAADYDRQAMADGAMVRLIGEQTERTARALAAAIRARGAAAGSEGE